MCIRDRTTTTRMSRPRRTAEPTGRRSRALSVACRSAQTALVRRHAINRWRTRAVCADRHATDSALERRPVGSAVRRGLDIAVVVVLFDLIAGLERERTTGVAGEVDICGHRVREVITLGGEELLLAGGGRPKFERHFLLGQYHHRSLPLLRVVLLRTEFERLSLIGVDSLIVEPAELQLLPRAEVARTGTERFARTVETALCHQRPVFCTVVLATRNVVVVGQAEIVTILVHEYTQAAVLRLDRVVTYPQTGIADCGAAELVVLR